MNSEKIGEFITSCRKTKGLTQQKLADDLGITNKAVSKWETGQGIPDVSLLPSLAELLGVTVDELLAGEIKAVNNSVDVNNTHNNNVDNNRTNNNTNNNTNYNTNSNTNSNVNNNANLKLQSHQSSDSNELALYLVNKSIIKFKNYVLLSVLFAIIGVIAPYSIWNETKDYTGLIFGIWLEFCSIGVFYVNHSIMKNEIKSYNKMYSDKIDYHIYSDSYIKINVWFWVLPPAVIVIFIIFNGLSINSTFFQFIFTIIIYIISSVLVRRKLTTKKTLEI